MYTINIEIIRVYKQGAKADDYKIENVLIHLQSRANVEIYDVTEANPVETDMMKKLLFACNEKNSDVILIIGNIGSLEKYLITEAIKNISDSKELPENIATCISNIETRLYDYHIMFHKTVCGIRNQTLIIDLSGPDHKLQEYYEAVANLILQVVHLKDTDKDQNMSLHDVASISDNDSTEQKEGKIVLKRRKTSVSPPVTPPNTIKRHKESFPMIPLDHALNIIHDIACRDMERITFETVHLSDAYGRILCQEVIATYDLPPFKTSTKHGYAVLTIDGKGLRRVLDVESTSPSMSLEAGTCVWVKSGAPIPDGATAVVQAKDTKLIEKSESSDDTYVEILVQPQNGQNIKPVGYDLTKGKLVAIPYTYIGPKEIALLAASGCREIRVVKNISIGIFSIGSNLEELEKPLKPGFIYDINRITLISLLKEKGFHSLDFGIVDNKLASIQNKIGEALKEVDILVTTGSTNDRDLLKTILETYCKADIHFGNVNIKPGKSTIFATCKIDDTEKYFMCLPGNPVSALVAAQLFLLPFVNELHNLYSEQTLIPTHVEQQYTLHSRSRVAWTILEWNENKEWALAFSKGNAVRDKLINALGANALLFLPGKESTLKDSSNAMALLVKFPKRFNEKNFCDARSEKKEDEP